MKRNVMAGLLAASLVAAPPDAGAQKLPVGYYIWLPDQSLTLTLGHDLTSPFQAEIRRDVLTPEDERRIRLAESLYPTADSTRARGCPENRAAENFWEHRCSSSYSPYALTSSAVKHYIDLIANFRRGDF